VNTTLTPSKGTHVSEVMTPDPVTMKANETVKAAGQTMIQYRTALLPVMDGERLTGVITGGDIVRLILRRSLSLRRSLNVPLTEVVSQRVASIHHGAPLHDALAVMKTSGIHRLIVLGSRGNLEGVVSKAEIKAGLAKRR
jgi:CBS domain-containing protein